MRVKTVLSILAAVNVLWAAAFFGYVQRSTTPVVRPGGEPAVTSVVRSNPALSVGIDQKAIPKTIAGNATNPTPVITPAPAPITNVVRAARQYGWQDVTNEIYPQ